MGGFKFAHNCCFLLFIGTPRSGHSIIGAILDAHPNALVSHEFHALKKISEGWTGNQLMNGIISTSVKQAAEGRSQSEIDHGDEYYLEAEPTQAKYRFDYSIPNQFQGQIDGRIEVIGDKKGGGSTTILAEIPELLQKLRDAVNLPIKLIYVVRNPYDNISTMAFRSGNSLISQVKEYRWYIENIHEILERETHECLTIYQEDFIMDTKQQLELICNWLKLDSSPSYIEDAASIVYKNPHESRNRLEWGDIERNEVENVIKKWPVLSRYKQPHN